MSNNEEIIFQKRIQDLARMAYNRNHGIPVFTDFLSMNELSVLHRTKLAGVRYETYGGYEFAERQIAMFVPDALFYDGYEKDFHADYPIVTLKISSVHKKFAQVLTHRDYLGALLGLGVDRNQIGDILVMENCAYAFCCAKMAVFFQTELRKVRNTSVKTEATLEEVDFVPHMQEIKGTVASLRIDVIIAMVYKLSRNRTLELFRSMNVFVNGRLTESNSQLLKEGEIISVRGYGRFLFDGVITNTKKGRYFIQVKKY